MSEERYVRALLRDITRNIVGKRRSEDKRTIIDRDWMLFEGIPDDILGSSQTQDTYIEKGKGEKEAMTDSQDYEGIVISGKDIETAVSVLANNHWRKLSSLPQDHEITRSYHLLNAMVGTDKYKEEIRSSIRASVKKQYMPTDIVEGTAGAFIFGCLLSDYGDTDKLCSPLCVSSLDLSDASRKGGECKSQVWVESGSAPQRFVRIFVPGTHPPPTSAHVYTKNDDRDDPFFREEIDAFKEAGISHVKLLYTKDNKHHTKRETQSVDSLPLVSIVKTKIERGEPKAREIVVGRTSLIPVIVLLIIIIIIVAVYMSA